MVWISHWLSTRDRMSKKKLTGLIGVCIFVVIVVAVLVGERPTQPELNSTPPEVTTLELLPAIGSSFVDTTRNLTAAVTD